MTAGLRESLEISIDFLKAFPGSNLKPDAYPSDLSLEIRPQFIGIDLSNGWNYIEFWYYAPFVYLFPGTRLFGTSDMFMLEKASNTGLFNLGIPWKVVRSIEIPRDH
jgi:hypothetical protein